MHVALCSLVLVLGGLQLTSAQFPPPPTLLVGAWLIENFDQEKADDLTIMGHIAQVVSRYDIILIQELRDNQTGHPVVTKLMNLLNPRFSTVVPIPVYDYVVSGPLGYKNTYLEEYLYVYRSDRVNVTRSKQCGNDFTFARPPYIVEFNLVGSFLTFFGRTVVEPFVLIPQHTCPCEAVRQMNGLVPVAKNLRTYIQNMLLLGDFNAGNSTVPPDALNNSCLRKNQWFHWLIPDYVTTMLTSKNANDRIVATTPMMNFVVHGSAQVHNFTAALDITHKEALAVSDHFPVEVELLSWIRWIPPPP